MTVAKENESKTLTEVWEKEKAALQATKEARIKLEDTRKELEKATREG